MAYSICCTHVESANATNGPFGYVYGRVIGVGVGVAAGTVVGGPVGTLDVELFVIYTAHHQTAQY